MKVGYYITEDASEIVNRVVVAEKLGFDSAWLGDHFVFWALDRVFPETWSMLAIAAANTSRIKLGSGVTDPFRRNVALLAQSAATLDYVSGGRGILGIGGGEAMNISPFGMEFRKPLSRLRETIPLVRKMWRSNVDQRVSFSSEMNRLDDAFLQISPVQDGSMPICVAGTSQAAKAIAGELADGWFGHVSSPSVFRNDLNDVQDAAERAGRKADEVEPFAWLMCFLGKDRETALRRAYPIAASELVVNHHSLEAMGIDLELPSELSLKNLILTRETVAKLHLAAGKVPRKAVEQTTAFGTPEDCIAIFEEFARAGAKNIIVLMPGSDLETMEVFSRRVMPHVEEL